MAFPIPANETVRLEHLRQLRSDEWGSSEALQELCSIASAVTQAPVALVSLLHENDQRFAAKIGIDLDGTSRDIAFCAHTIMSAEPMLVSDATADKRFASNALVTDAPHIRAYAGVPLEAAPGVRVGTLCAIDFEPRKFSNEQIDLLSKLGTVASSLLQLHRMRLELEEEIAARRLREEELWEAAHRDLLTGLPNLKQFREFATKVLDDATGGQGCALILIDLDHFKSVNDRWGHAEGDAYLREVAVQLTLSIRKQDLAARLGGDEFGVILADIDGQDEATYIAKRILSNLKLIADRMGRPDLGRASLGIALSPQHSKNLDDLYKAADFALYAAKTAGRNTHRVYIPHFNRRSADGTNIFRDYRRGLEAGEFVPYYQPKVELQKRALAGFEALARWNTAGRGVLAPADFQDLLEDVELAPLLTRSMLTQMAKSLFFWQELGLDCGPLAVNVSAPDFFNEDFATDFLRIISDHKLQPQSFVLEVTERVFVEDHDKSLYKTLQTLQDSGVLIALDDFGTGYAGLQHLRTLPVNAVKIDRMFIRDCLEDSRDSAIVEGIIQMADSIGLGVTAEGIETEAQLEHLRNLQCEMGQGYIFARPMPFADVPDYVRNFGHPIVNVDG